MTLPVDTWYLCDVQRIIDLGDFVIGRAEFIGAIYRYGHVRHVGIDKDLFLVDVGPTHGEGGMKLTMKLITFSSRRIGRG